MYQEAINEEYKMNIHLIGFEIQKDLLTKKEITIKVSANQDNSKHSNCSKCPEEYKTSATIPVDKIGQSNQIFNVLIPNRKVNNEKMNQIIMKFKTKDHKLAYSVINYHDFIQKLNEEENDDVYSKDNNKNKLGMKNKYMYDQTQTIPIYLYDKSKQNEFICDTSKGTVIGSMKIKLTFFQIRKNNNEKSKDNKNNIKHKSSSNFINLNKHILINMHKFKNYHLEKREQSDYQKSNQTYQIKKQFENLL